MAGPKISIDCVLPRENPGGFEGEAHKTKRLARDRALLQCRAQFNSLLGACLEVLDLLGEARDYIEVIKVRPRKAEYTIGTEMEPRTIFRVHAVFNKGEKFETDEIEIDVSEPDQDSLMRNVRGFKKELYDSVRRLIIRRIGLAQNLHSSWMTLLPPTLPEG